MYLIESNNSNYSAGFLSATLIYGKASEKAIEIEWSPPLSSCMEFLTDLWIRVFESDTLDQTNEPYLIIPKKCLKSKKHVSGRESVYIILPSSNDASVARLNSTDDGCHNFSIQIIDCHSYQVKVIPNYQSHRGKFIRTEIIIFPSKVTEKKSKRRNRLTYFFNMYF